MNMQTEFEEQIKIDIKEELEKLEVTANTSGDSLVLELVVELSRKVAFPPVLAAKKIKAQLQDWGILSWDDSVIGYVPIKPKQRKQWLKATAMDLRPYYYNT